MKTLLEVFYPESEMIGFVREEIKTTYIVQVGVEERQAIRLRSTSSNETVWKIEKTNGWKTLTPDSDEYQRLEAFHRTA